MAFCQPAVPLVSAMEVL